MKSSTSNTTQKGLSENNISKPRDEFIKKGNIFFCIGIVILLSIWFILSLYENNIVVPSIPSVIEDIFSLIISKKILLIVFTIIKLLLILIVSFVISYLIAFFSYKYIYVRKLFAPIIAFMRSVPIASFVFILLLLIGDEFTPFIITSFVIIPVASETLYSHFNNIDKSIIDETKLVSNINLKIFSTLFIPMLLKQIISVVLSCFGLGLKVMIMSEVILYTENTIGYEIQMSKNEIMDFTRLYSWTIIVLILVFVVEGIIKKIENKIK